MRPKIDYSPKTVTRRLKQVDDLRRTCLVLAGPRLKWDWRKTSGAVSEIIKKRQKKCH
jgi:hypothetical protein